MRRIEEVGVFQEGDLELAPEQLDDVEVGVDLSTCPEMRHKAKQFAAYLGKGFSVQIDRFRQDLAG